MSHLDDAVALITINPGGPFLASVRAGLADVGLHPATLIVVSPRQRLWKEWKRHRLGIVHQVIIPKLKGMAGAKERTSDDAATRSIPGRQPRVVRVPSLNGRQTRRVLQELGIRYLINGGAGIFRPAILDLPGLRVLNAHAGDLPRYRNMNVVEWALHERAPVIGTVHLIDRSLDTGAVVLRRPIDLAGTFSLTAAREKAFDQVARLLGTAVLGLETGELKPEPQGAGGRTWYTMHSHYRRQLEQSFQSRWESPGKAY